MNREEAEALLQKTFQVPKFYDKQWQVIEKILNGKKILLIAKTGFGKSLCFQFPAIVFSGTTVIFSPLIALMRDQVKKMRLLGISARCINGEQTVEENTQVIEDAKQRKIKILYITPERQENYEWIEASPQINLSMIVVDEAHCISVWGHDFRPAFKRIVNLVKLLPKELPILATTATATKQVEQDIVNQIGNDITTIRGNLIRKNLKLFVLKVNSEDEKLIWLGKNLKNYSGSGLIYTGTRFNTKIYSKWLNYLKYSSVSYNAGLDRDHRIDIESGLMNNQWKCIVSTNALGMGIDKSDIRFVIHTQIPQSLIHYYQEIGRAGRDGEPSYIILFYNPNKDKKLPESFIENSRPSIKKYQKVIEVVKTGLYGQSEIIRKTDLKENQFRVIKSDLLEQGIIREVFYYGRKSYEFIPNSQSLNARSFEELKEAKIKDLEKMIEYIETTDSRMKFLCDYLGDDSNQNFTNCDNTNEQKIQIIVTPEWIGKLRDFRENDFPELEVESKGSNITNGIASSYYGVSHIGKAIHRSKYENGGDFPDFLLKLTLTAFAKKFDNERFDLILYVPSTKSGDLVRNFAEKLSKALNIPISHGLKKSKETEEQKKFESKICKENNVKNVFSYENYKEIIGKKILLFDDICDSCTTIKEVGKFLTDLGVIKISPLVIAKTTEGDLV